MFNEMDFIKYLGMIIIKADPREVEREVNNKLLVHITKDYYIVNLPKVLKFTENIMVVDALLKKYPVKFEPMHSHPIITLFYKKVFSNFPDKLVVKDEKIKQIFEKYYGFEGIDYIQVLRKFLTPITNHECVLIIKELGYVYFSSSWYCNKYFKIPLDSYRTLNYVPMTLQKFTSILSKYFMSHRRLLGNVELFELKNSYPLLGIMIDKRQNAYLITVYDDKIYGEIVLIEIYGMNGNKVKLRRNHTTINKFKKNYCVDGEDSNFYLFHINSFKELILYDYIIDKFKFFVVDDMKSYDVRRNEVEKNITIRINGEYGREALCRFKMITGNVLDNTYH